MSALAKQLAGLRRQAGAASAIRPVDSTPAPAPSTPGPASTADQVARLRKLLGLRPRALATVHSLDRRLDGIELAPGLRLIESWVPFQRLPDRLDLAALGMGELETCRILAFDTETTGLAGGTGTRAFMIGAADWCGGQLRIRQLTLASMRAEAAMLDVFASWLQPRSILCSYNGKCYDAPLLATRYRLARRGSPLAGLRHVDLLYPTRRSYRGVYENCRLATIERQVLKIVREDDLPGSEAPAAWLSYIRGGGSGLLRRVLAHNRQDVITLSRLLASLSGVGTTEGLLLPAREAGAGR